MGRRKLSIGTLSKFHLSSSFSAGDGCGEDKGKSTDRQKTTDSEAKSGKKDSVVGEAPVTAKIRKISKMTLNSMTLKRFYSSGDLLANKPTGTAPAGVLRDRPTLAAVTEGVTTVASTSAEKTEDQRMANAELNLAGEGERIYKKQRYRSSPLPNHSKRNVSVDGGGVILKGNYGKKSAHLRAPSIDEVPKAMASPITYNRVRRAGIGFGTPTEVEESESSL